MTIAANVSTDATTRNNSVLLDAKLQAAGSRPDPPNSIDVSFDDDRCTDLPTITREQLAQHCTPEDCWIAIKGLVYDLSAYLPTHPGGDLMLQAAGMDGTHIFITTHPQAVMTSLLESQSFSERFCVGKLPQTEESDRKFCDPFHNELQQEVEAYFRRTGLPMRDLPAMYVKSVLIWCYIITMWTLAIIHQSIWLAMLTGVGCAMNGMCLMHDTNHGGFTRHAWLLRLSNFLGCLTGISTPVWRVNHQMMHHNDTNGKDDLDVHNYPMLRHSPSDPRLWAHRFQHLYAIPLYCMGALNLCVRYLIAFIKFRNVSRIDRALSTLGSLAQIGVLLLLPALTSASLCFGISMFIAYSFGAGAVLFNIFAVNHLAVDLQEHSNVWSRNQVITTMDYATGSLFWLHFTGGLNHQTIHHMFPSICHIHYRELTPILMQATLYQAQHSLQLL